MTEADEMDVHALADGELSPPGKKRVQARMDKDPAMQCKYRQIVAQKHLLLRWAQAQKAAKPGPEKELEAVDARH